MLGQAPWCSGAELQEGSESGHSGYAAAAARGEARTTVMIRNLACRYTQEDVKTILDESGFRGLFDFVYMPRSTSMTSNLGYVFVNFKREEHVEMCRTAFHGRSFGGGSAKVCEVALARRQGGYDLSARGKKKGRAKPLVIEETTQEPAERRGDAEAQVDPATATTAMLKNIPCQYTQEAVVRILDGLGLAGKYDVIYVPRSPAQLNNLGYAFVNFLAPEFVSECVELCHGKPFGHSASEKICEVVLARIQGPGFAAQLMERRVKGRNKHVPLVLQASSGSAAQASTPSLSASSAAASAAEFFEERAFRVRDLVGAPKAEGEDLFEDAFSPAMHRTLAEEFFEGEACPSDISTPWFPSSSGQHLSSRSRSSGASGSEDNPEPLPPSPPAGFQVLAKFSF